MAKRIVSYLLTAAMLFSVLLLSSCWTETKTEVSGKEEIVLTPKEKFLESSKCFKAYFDELSKAFGFDTDMAPPEDGKMEVNSFSYKLNKLKLGEDSYITDPFSISGEAYNDAQNKILRTLGKLILNGETVRFEQILTPAAMYVNINKVTEKTLKYLLPQEDNSAVDESVKLNEYFDYFMDNLSDDLFTAESGKVTVEGVEFDGETVTFKATLKQFGEAFVKVLEKAKTDAQLEQLIKILDFTNIVGDNAGSLSDWIDSVSKPLLEAIVASKDSDNLTVSVISENGVLRSITFTGIEGGKKYEFALTTTVKDGAHFVKCYAKSEEKTHFEISYQQKPNDKGSCDGQLVVTFDSSADSDESKDTGDISKSAGDDLFGQISLKNLTVSVNFSGQKTDNKVAVDAKIELTTEQSGMKVTLPLNVNIKYEKVSDTENKFSVNVSFSFMGYEADFTISGGRYLIPYAALEVPTDDEVQVIDESFNLEPLLVNLMKAYPGIGAFLQNLFMPDTDNFPGDLYDSGVYIYTDNEELAAYLYDSGVGWICPILFNVEYADGQYTAQLYDGTELSGTYKQSGTSLTIDDVGGYTYEIVDNNLRIKNDEIGSYVTFLNQDTCLLETFFEYQIENGKIRALLYTGGVLEYTHQEKGDKIVINGVSFNTWRFSNEEDANT
ncbi:MAG TPA: hypothetical protein PKV51_03045 [Bacillota bacterium]|nr:hypothetical protein [Bacillota bacterium]HPP85110.1 hypothetical protein [Bacillota bacterium]